MFMRWHKHCNLYICVKSFLNITVLSVACCVLGLHTSAQDSSLAEQGEIYTLKPSVDLPIIAAAGGWSYYALSKIYKKDSSSAEDILSLNRKNINVLDR